MSGRAGLVAVFLVTLPLVTPKIRGADEIEYFSYLPSLVFDHDLDFGDEYQHFYARDPAGLAGFKATFLDRREVLTGRHINFGPIGSAVLWSPFYLLAHGATRLAHALGSDVPADGLSWPYVAAACYASALLGFVGLLLARDLLVRFGGSSDPVATLSVLALWLGTPVLYYMTVAPGFAHAASLFAVSLLVWLWLRARAQGDAAGPRDWALVGLAGGLCGLIREQDVLFLALPALWLAYEGVRTRAGGRALARGAALAAAALLAMTPQLLVYRALTGRFGPSRLVTRKVSHLSPHFFEVLFDPAHGLFAWTPLLLLATAGLLLALWRRRDGVTALFALGLLLQVWINGALESWTQAGAFGSRRFVAATPLFAWGLAALVGAAWPRLGRVPVAATVALFAWWNVSLMVQFGLKLMDRQRLEWPRVAVNQFTEVPARLGRVAVLFFTDRERLVRGGAVISEALLARVACPVCLETGGCATCARPGAGHAACAAEYASRVRCACGGPDKRALARETGALLCPCCQARYPLHVEAGYVDLLPRAAVGETTQYADHEFHERMQVTEAPPVLSARVKADMMLRMLDPRRGEPVLDLGCGAGKLAVYAGREGSRTAGLDAAPFFLPGAAAVVDLALGDLRRLPFRKGAYARAYSLDVLEHLDEEGLRDVLVEARRVVGRGGRLFVYTHAMESSRLAVFQRAVNRLARRLGQAGLIDHEREALRKTDHRNAIRSHEHFDALCADAGLEVAARRYYNVVVKAVVEDLGLRLFEQARRRGPRAPPAGRDHAHGDGHGHDHAPVAARSPGRLLIGIATALTWLLKLDVVLFGGVRTGPFFGLLRPRP